MAVTGDRLGVPPVPSGSGEVPPEQAMERQARRRRREVERQRVGQVELARRVEVSCI